VSNDEQRSGAALRGVWSYTAPPLCSQALLASYAWLGGLVSQEYSAADGSSVYLVTAGPHPGVNPTCVTPPCFDQAFGPAADLTFSWQGSSNASAPLPAVKGSLSLGGCYLLLSAWAEGDPQHACIQRFSTGASCLPSPPPPAAPAPAPGRASAFAKLSAHGALAVYAVIAIVGALAAVCAIGALAHFLCPILLYGQPPQARRRKRAAAEEKEAPPPTAPRTVAVPGSEEMAARLTQATHNAAAAAAASGGAHARTALAGKTLNFASPAGAPTPAAVSSVPTPSGGSTVGGGPKPWESALKRREVKESLREQGLYASPVRGPTVHDLEAEQLRSGRVSSIADDFELPTFLK